MNSTELTHRKIANIRLGHVLAVVAVEGEGRRDGLDCEWARLLWLRQLGLAVCCMFGLVCASHAQERTGRTGRIEFVCAEKNPGKGLTETTDKYTSERLYLHRRRQANVFSLADIMGARVIKPKDSDSVEVEIAFSKKGAAKIARITKDCLGKNLAMLINNKIISAPILNARIYDKTRIFGALTEDQAQEIADAINCCGRRTEQRQSIQTRPARSESNIHLEIRLADWTPSNALKQVIVPHTGQHIYLHKNPLVTNKDITAAQALKYHYEDSYDVEVTLTRDAAARINRSTQERIGKPLAVLIDGRVISVPVVISEIHDKIAIAGKFTKADAERIALILSAH